MNIDHPQLFAALSNETRLRCLHLIVRNGEVCVCEITESLRITQPTASKALKTLKAAGLLEDRKDANWNYYQLNGEMQAWVKKMITDCCSSLAERSTYTRDQKRFLKSELRPQ